jgi:K+-transporting ATPase ATPase C chain
MLANLRANLWLLVMTLLLCSGLYPLFLWGVGQAAFRQQAEGSLLRGTDGKTVVGSRLIGQAFTKDEYFQPRPSATSPAYNAAASGASNWGACNPLLRDRVARALGPIVKYNGKGPKKGQPVGPDIETWFKDQAPDFTARWASSHSTLAEQWIKDHPDAVASWLEKPVDEVKNSSAESAKVFFQSFAQRHPGYWPTVEEVKGTDGQTSQHIKPMKDGPDVQAYLFDPWLQEHADADLEKVPADLVMASGSGLDPHITLQNAHYQLDRVAGAWVEKTKADPGRIRQEIERILEEKKEAPLAGLAGVPLVNVLEVNLALAERMPQIKPSAR